jgi:hypothetical protein
LTASDAAAGDRLGWSVALSGDTLLAGAPQNHSVASFAGAAYVFVRAGAAWSEQKKLVSADSAALDSFGYAVALLNNTAIVGSVLDGSFAPSGGSAYVFTRAGSAWSQSSEFSAGDIERDFRFGYSVAISGATIFVGAPFGTFFQEGAAYLYELTSNNTAPTADPQSVVTDEDTAAVVTLTGTDPEGDPLTFTVLSGPTQGTLSGTLPGLIYTPFVNASGPDSFTFKVNDGDLDSPPATVSINVTPVNDGPAISGISDRTIPVNSTAGPIPFTLDDVDNDPASLVVSANSDNPTLVPVPDIVLGGSGADRTITITPAANQFGTTTITLTVSDGLAVSQTSFLLTVSDANHSPTADAGATTPRIISSNNADAAVTLDGTRSSDADNDPLTFTWLENGNAIASDAVTQVTLPVGTHTITLVVSDGTASASATVTVRVVTLAGTIEEIVAAIQTTDIPSALKTEMNAILRAAAGSCARGNLVSGANQLQAFENKVAAQAGKKIDETTANSLIADAENVIHIITGSRAAKPQL